ncbi:MAG TPA: Hpt domain-containing protein [Bacteroidia bacterium]|jgi:HPt (histidine-containing phosphotransfer) domain-containing protein|nr:Hpt domain-containing protein [Bacteroidia bacterium]
MLPQKVTNLAYLNEISKGDADFIKEMIGIFLSETPDEINQLEKAIAETNFAKIRAISHHMKSTIPFVGLDLVIGNDLIQIEDSALNQKDIEIIKASFTKVKVAFHQAHQELNN